MRAVNSLIALIVYVSSAGCSFVSRNMIERKRLATATALTRPSPLCCVAPLTLVISACITVLQDHCARVDAQAKASSAASDDAPGHSTHNKTAAVSAERGPDVFESQTRALAVANASADGAPVNAAATLPTAPRAHLHQVHHLKQPPKLYYSKLKLTKGQLKGQCPFDIVLE